MGIQALTISLAGRRFSQGPFRKEIPLPGQRIHVGTFQFSDEDMTMMQTERARFMARVVVTYDDVFRLRQEAAFDFFAIIHSPRKGRI